MKIQSPQANVHNVALRRSAFTLIEIMIVVGIIGLLAIAIIPNISKNRERAQLQMIHQNLRKIDAAKNLWALENNKGSGETPSSEELKPYDGWPRAIAGETYNIKSVGMPPSATLSGKLWTNGPNSTIQLPQD
jgi:prepilin-type N-terminal cleavage/methylation domain-containing protein